MFQTKKIIKINNSKKIISSPIRFGMIIFYYFYTSGWIISVVYKKKF